MATQSESSKLRYLLFCWANRVEILFYFSILTRLLFDRDEHVVEDTFVSCSANRSHFSLMNTTLMPNKPAKTWNRDQHFWKNFKSANVDTPRTAVYLGSILKWRIFSDLSSGKSEIKKADKTCTRPTTSRSKSMQ